MNASVQVSVTINAEPETVWRFMSNRERFLSWMTFVPGSPTPEGSVFEPRAGGELRIIFPNGGEARGNVVELEPLRKLVFTWGYDPDVAQTGLKAGSCRVEVALMRIPEGTRVTLTHSGPMSEQIAKAHEAGWRHYLAQLAVVSTRSAVESHIGVTLETYFAACNERDDAKRMDLLGRCCEDAIRVRTAFACVDSVEDFNGHIANGLKHMPGVVSAQDGDARHIHGIARVPWKVSGPDGSVYFRGDNVMRFSARGKIEDIVSIPS